MTEGEMVRRHQWLNGHEFEQTPGVGDGQGGLACRSPWGHKESDMTEWLNWTFTFIKTLFSSSSLSAIRVVSSDYLRLLIFLPAILVPACASFSLAFCMMYSAYKLNTQGDSIQAWRTPFPIWNQSVVCSMPGSNCPILTCIQISQEAGQVVWYSCLFKNFPVYCDLHS